MRTWSVLFGGETAIVRTDYKADAAVPAASATIIDDDAMEFGQLYRSSVVIGAGDELPPALRPEQWAGQPGTRAPHLWVARDGERLSTLDLFGQRWVLLADDEQWRPAVAQAGEQLGIELKCLHVDVRPDDPEAFRRAFGLGMTGASLVRPDGHVAWRSTDLPAGPRAAHRRGCRRAWQSR
jgi:hypothetical protein